MKFKNILFFFLALFCQALFCQDSIDERIGVWQINKGVLVINKSNKNDLANDYWKEFYRIFPKELTTKYIKRLVLMTDGEQEKVGALVSLNSRNDKWQLEIDVKDVNLKTRDKKILYESVYTMVHEFGHLLTLNKTQIRPTNKRKQEEGELYLTHEGEAYRKSYINRFVNLFWKGKLLNRWDVIQRDYCYTEANCVDKLFDLYQDNSSEFLTDYAVESPEEDIVESWTAFVLRPRIKKPRTIAHKKRNFFYQFPELVAYRKTIRQKTRKYLH
ncbi:hypothetical protein J2Q11_04995 [Tenacibaculum finnmarkense genomovar finnmarkense]|uniref:Zinc-dependent metalloprotease n=1 Tax=Tenacibaculum finnmarkense genomovar finnmarkense TaxID=1458503 RepID=A0AAP1REV1_9FLAO|nr:hypothetical protein [Tenacibaculum finnmarkense]MBE7652559.1 hypothetical protein [Tenacibaculum finnmarkense genomovar finnmarkense]MBE7660799.1 hypothetical protein [Tenacibaculum finnmarkense genomovar finnmarkense]MBE7692653.1 hypothetical protein [Tenacibaculum finnmarkense genomovar finnmarkense]MBE7694858.1 hypothetical protein [Tenacibaculum finnmarkense genomovar finnmarkense]MCD8399890.1 hypothetical protein [Tenacibaculum finnmarkense genomovar ulcerans]